VALAGKRTVYGFRGDVMGKLWKISWSFRNAPKARVRNP